MFNKSLMLGLVVFVSTFSHLAVAKEGQWKYSTGVDFSSGDYDGDPVDTEITYVPFTVSYKQGRWELKATVPWLEIKGPGTVIGAGDGGVVIGDPDSVNVQTTRESGLGDIWLTAKYAVVEIPAELFYLDLAAKFKIPSADEDKGLGTGEFDYTLQTELFKPLGALTPFATLAYKVKGDPSGIDLDNVWYTSLGSDYRVSDTLNIGASVDFQEASTSASDDAFEVFGYLSQKITPKFSVTLYGYKGLKDGSPDYGGGVQLTYKP